MRDFENVRVESRGKELEVIDERDFEKVPVKTRRKM